VAAKQLARAALSQWCGERLGSEPESILFTAGHLSEVRGLRLADGRQVVVKVRRWEDRLVRAFDAKRRFSVGGSRDRPHDNGGRAAVPPRGAVTTAGHRYGKHVSEMVRWIETRPHVPCGRCR
jgi:hypothetical protein